MVKTINKSLTIIKIGDHNYTPSPEDLEKWRSVFAGELSKEEMLEKFPHLKEVPIEQTKYDTNLDSTSNKLMLVRVGDEKYQPTKEDLESWREIFEQAAYDPDFKIFTHSKVEIDIIDIDKDGTILVE